MKQKGRARHRFVQGDPHIVWFERKGNEVVLTFGQATWPLTETQFNTNYEVLED